MAAKQKYPEIVSGNRLTDGAVVYLSAEGGWVEKIEDASVAETEDERAALEDAANGGIATQQVTGWEFAEITEEDGGRKAVKNIQHIRSLGPTVRRDLGKQAELYQ
ncbi:MAG: DUF2849 domain-containing protein [Alphaproteobacteria bacterium]